MSGAGPASPARGASPAPPPADRRRDSAAAGSPIQPIIKGKEGAVRAPGGAEPAALPRGGETVIEPRERPECPWNPRDRSSSPGFGGVCRDLRLGTWEA